MAQNSYDGQYFVDDIVSVKPKYPKLFNVYGTSCISWQILKDVWKIYKNEEWLSGISRIVKLICCSIMRE